MTNANATVFYWPELLTQPSGRPTEKRKVYIVEENGDTEIPTNHLFIKGQLKIYPWVENNDYLTVSRKRSSWVFKAGRHIGLIPLNEFVMLDVQPRVPVKNLTRIMRIAEDKPRELDAFLSYYSEHRESVPSMLDVFARALIARIKEIDIYGLHREYVTRAQATSFPRGRIHVGETMRRYSARGIQHRVAASWYESTVDTAVNRCLKYTLSFLAAHYNSTDRKSKAKKDILRGLQRSYHMFSGVELDKSLRFLRSRTVNEPEVLPSIRSYYKPALYLALLLLQNRGISFRNRQGGILISSLLINLQTTFEQYSRNVLRARMRDIETQVRVLDGNVKAGQKPLFDEPIRPRRESPIASPDIVVKRISSETDAALLVAEVKYIDSVEPKRSDVNQAAMYALSYGAPVVIVHPAVKGGKTHGMHLLGRKEPHCIYHYVFDLAATDPDAEDQMFANSFRELLHL